MTDIFKDHCINLVEKSAGTGISDGRQVFRLIIGKYKNHPSILAIIQKPEQVMEGFTFQEVDNKEVAQLLKFLDGRKSTGEENAANELTNTLTSAINSTIRNSYFPNDT